MLETHAPISIPGSLTFFTGPMACGKTLELIRQLQIFHEQKIPMVCLRPEMDTRTSTVQSRAGLFYNAHTVCPTDTKTLQELCAPAQVIGVDEVEFFPPALIDLLFSELKGGKTILVSGLDTDFRGRLFPTAEALLAIPEAVVHRMRAVCAVCRKYNATRNQRLRHGKPVPMDDPTIVVEGSQEGVTYEARCLEHHIIAP